MRTVTDPMYVEHAKRELRDLGIDDPTAREAQIFVRLTEWWIDVAAKEYRRGRTRGRWVGGLLVAVAMSGAIVGALWMG
jgi:hypothetical protein